MVAVGTPNVAALPVVLAVVLAADVAAVVVGGDDGGGGVVVTTTAGDGKRVTLGRRVVGADEWLDEAVLGVIGGLLVVPAGDGVGLAIGRNGDNDDTGERTADDAGITKPPEAPAADVPLFTG